MERWSQIREFPDYSVSDHGRVRYDDSGRIMALTQNQHGVVNVGMTKQGVQYKRGVALLVATAFIERMDGPFDTPINVDGNRSNCHYTNLMWRPRWFAIKYHAQFMKKTLHIKSPIIEINTRERFHNSHEAILCYGLLEEELVMAVHNKTFVFPTYQVFELV
jgi:hypothetical protein